MGIQPLLSARRSQSWRSLVGFILGIVATGLPAQPVLAHLGHDSLWVERLTQTSLSPSVRLGGIGIAILAGAGHAFSPGHGKTMVAAYLIGSRGTPKHALILGVVTTVTHTLGVFLLGLLALFASNYLLPEQLYPILSLLSGLMICFVGFWLLDRQLQAQQGNHGHGHSHGHGHDHSHGDDHGQAHSHEPAYAQGIGHGFAHGSAAHEHLPHFSVPQAQAELSPVQSPHTHLPSSFSLRSLMTLGIAGGIVPCPSALVLLLSAISLHQTAYGLLLVGAFSGGLAVVLVSVGLMVIYAQSWLRVGSWLDPLQRVLPKISAIAVIAIGLVMVLFATL